MFKNKKEILDRLGFRMNLLQNIKGCKYYLYIGEFPSLIRFNSNSRTFRNSIIDHYVP